MTKYAALDVSMEQTAICVVDENGRKLAEGKVATDPDAIADWLAGKTGEMERIGMETGPLAVWLWNELTRRGLPIVCLDARHASAALSMMPNKTDRHDAAGLAQIVRTGWFKEVRIKSHGAYVVRALLSARDLLVGVRSKIENEIRGLLKTFGIMFGKKVGGFARRARRRSPWRASLPSSSTQCGRRTSRSATALPQPEEELSTPPRSPVPEMRPAGTLRG